MGSGVAARVADTQGRERPFLGARDIGDRQHVQRVDEQEIVAGLPGRVGPGAEVRDRLRGASVRIVDPPALQFQPCAQLRIVGSLGLGRVQLGERLLSRWARP